jgi:hypothetical protein
MTDNLKKRQLLQEAGYIYNFDRMVYVNRDAKKVFSVEFVEDHDEDNLRQKIAEMNEGAAWRFYFNSNPSKSVQEELEEVLG